MGKILVTGGAGFIGSHLIDRLLAAGREVTCLDLFDDFYDPAIKRRNLAAARSSPLFHLVEGDIRDERLVEDVLREEDPDVLVHLAARAGVRPSIEKPLLYQDVNVRGTALLLEACRRQGTRRFLFASSSSVYGNNRKVPFSEKDSVDHPVSPYAATKKAGELLGYTYHHLHGLHFWALRLFTVFGPRQRPEMAIHKFTRLIDRGEEVPQFGDGSSRRDYTYIDDITEALMFCIDRIEGYEIINLGESRTTTLAELIELISNGLGKPARVRVLPAQPGDVEQTWADIRRAAELIGYRPRFTVEEGIRPFLDWYLRERKGA
ncbi:MAG: epimerase [Acidobacteria bacterium]|nr:MAG: epimerase [Acidobacteriota bacterium]